MKKIKKIKNRIISLLLISVMIFNSNAYAAVPEYIGSGYLLYNDKAYAKLNFSTKRNKDYIDALKVIQALFKDAVVSYVPVPQSQIIIENEKSIVDEGYTFLNQKDALKQLNEWINGDINLVDMYDNLLEHKDEYIYFDYDLHWTSRGAYYGYEAFCKSRGLPYKPLDTYTEHLLNNSYKGSAYMYTNDARIADKRDKLYAYQSDVTDKLEIISNLGNNIGEMTCINLKSKTYSGVFIGGDQPLEVITSYRSLLDDKDMNKDTRCALVIKDSFGCAFVPYLTYNYDVILVVDPRFADFKLVDRVKDYKINDIIVVNAMYGPAKDDILANLVKMIS